MRWTALVAIVLASCALNSKTAFAQSGALAPGLCFTRGPTNTDKSTKLNIDGAVKELGQVRSIKIINAGSVTIIEAYFSDGPSAYTETFVSQGHRLDMFLGLFSPGEICPAPAARTN
jgi:hypothetical protein